MNEDGKVKVGKIIDAHGIKGEIAIFVFSGDVSWLPSLRSLFINKKNQLEEHVVIKKRAHKKGFICLLEKFDNRNLAEEYKGREVWISSEFFVSEEGQSLFLNEILGFEVVEEKAGSLGVINAFSSNGIQDLLVIEKLGNKPIEIPFVKEFVTEMDFKNKKIRMNLPEGLLEINDEE